VTFARGDTSGHAPDARVQLLIEDDGLRAELIEILRAESLIPTESPPPSPTEPPPSVLIAAGQLFPHDERSLVSILRERAGPDCGLVIVVERLARREVRRAIDAGVDGLVLESQVRTALAPTVRAVLAGQLVLPREHGAHLEPPRLSVREKQVLSLVVMGMSNREIATQLYIGETTVKTHLSAAFRKLGVESRGEAARVISDPSEGLGTGILRISPEEALPEIG
jgi:DNA-binding NarL/FixJ family response regulator